ncbi:hypothetical protein [Blastococcus sp. VKM Ac-2987]|uniref:hypothetical protein n=1 Tax=Blastococcus sp. VKM Ac-2987 TaxID=3004141 RepID=UPI0022ABA642|nr:hypothetical protein [Blastococcus sp. VKM Ac-2987]MCZ2857424.1 hypothetical protein [Blastococcus sp. VKM Ac-2987]
MAGKPEPIRVEGLRELRSTLKNSNKELKKDFDKSLRLIGVETALDARRRASSEGGALAKGASSIVGGVDFRGAFVRFGGPKAPFMAGAEFGGGAHGKGNPTARGGYTTQFRPWTGNNDDAGYAIWPTIRHRQDGPNRELTEAQINQFIHRNNLG